MLCCSLFSKDFKGSKILKFSIKWIRVSVHDIKDALNSWGVLLSLHCSSLDKAFFKHLPNVLVLLHWLTKFRCTFWTNMRWISNCFMVIVATSLTWFKNKIKQNHTKNPKTNKKIQEKSPQTPTKPNLRQNYFFSYPIMKQKRQVFC